MKGKGKREYTTVHIPKELAKAIDRLLDCGAYSSRAEFIKEAIRSHFKSLDLADLIFGELKKRKGVE